MNNNRQPTVNGRFTLAVLVLLAFGIRWLASEYMLSTGRSWLPDSELYWGIAESVESGRGFVVGDGGARRTPGYPLLVLAAHRLSGFTSIHVPPSRPEIRAVLIAQALCGALIVCLVWRISRVLEIQKVIPIGTAFWSAFFAAIDPLAIAVSAMVLTETPFALGLLASTWAYLHAWRGEAHAQRWGFPCGVLFGITIMVRPSILIFSGMLVGLTIVRRFRVGLVMAVGLITILAPWWIRNAMVYHRFVPTTLNVGESLYDGWNSEADGGSNMAFIDRHKLKQDLTQPWWERELADDAHWRKAALDWATHHTGRVWELACIKAVRFWSPGPNAAEFRSPWIVVLCSAFSIAIFLLAFVGLAVAKHKWCFAWVSIAPAMYFMLMHAVFVSSIRYRIPTMPLWEIASGAGLAWLVAQRFRRG